MENKEFISILFAQASILLELFEEDTEDHKSQVEDVENIIIYLNRYKPRNPMIRMQGYVEEVVASYSEEQFKSHFRFVWYFLYKYCQISALFLIVRRLYMMSSQRRNPVDTEYQLY